jgi:hypothetical protein
MSGTGQSGAAMASGSASVQVTGNFCAAQRGEVTATGSSSAPAPGLGASGLVGAVTVATDSSEDAVVETAGVSAETALASVTVTATEPVKEPVSRHGGGRRRPPFILLSPELYEAQVNEAVAVIGVQADARVGASSLATSAQVPIRPAPPSVAPAPVAFISISAEVGVGSVSASPQAGAVSVSSIRNLTDEEIIALAMAA